MCDEFNFFKYYKSTFKPRMVLLITMYQSDCRLVQTNIYKENTVKSYTCINGPQEMEPGDFGDPLTIKK